ncbi:Fic/DOC family protein [Micromonospora chaiyaphumensis]|uniref:Fic/DOC family protein n=1 Tax=Micromonospora chaiyaphumensis TaxID=307119 RepID=A0A1C4W361_9ACTN|nr:Fic/DOC family protein [Micromonospora chaiyaphumensis]
MRDSVGWRHVVPHSKAPGPAIRDGFVDFAHGSAGHDPRRLSRLLSAYDDVRLEAAAGADLTSDLLARWNRLVRGVPVAAFRRAAAFAKNGRERYGLHADTEQRFASCLADTADRETPVTARAARAYLDVAFFHPHDDGNARSAGLVLQFVLLRERVELDEVAPILTTVRRADDAEGAADLARLVHGIATATRRRWLRANR